MAASNSPAYERSVELLRDSLSPSGYLASTAGRDNYRRVWARDGAIAGLAGLASGEPDLIEGMRRTLLTLAANQGPHGEIPSNVAPDEVSYGSLVGRVDAPLWFLIALGRYVRLTGDRELSGRLKKAAERALFLLGCWEMNNRGLLYVPQGGDWADEYPISGYNLYDQVLYYLALTECAAVYGDEGTGEKAKTLGVLIEANYVLDPTERGSSANDLSGAVPKDDDPMVLHPAALARASSSAGSMSSSRLSSAGTEGEEGTTTVIPTGYFAASFSPAGYSTVFDGLGNSLALLAGIGSPRFRSRVADSIAGISASMPFSLIPAFFPPIQPNDPEWTGLTLSYRYSFRNEPYEYHNGGLWPMVTGFYACGLVRLGRVEQATQCLEGISAAVALGGSGRSWGFYEFIHGQDGSPRGTERQTWSAAAVVLVENALKRGEPVL